MNSVRDLKLLPVWVNPGHLAQTALLIMLGHKVKALAVLDGDQLVGTLALEDLVAASETATVRELMKPVATTFEAQSNVREIAEAFVSAQIDFAPIVDEEHFLGIVTPVMLLKELGRSYDPLTNLSWSDRLREWGVDHLRNGEEVTIIFVDLNHFGLYNKKYGHIVGDRVIRKVADYLSTQIDFDLDVLVRYGGDEFAIGTLRDRDESDALAELLAKRFDGEIEGADEPVSFSTGVFGGRRNKERESVHYAATIDNLINIASKNCIANKKRARGEDTETAKPTKVEFKVLGIYADEGVTDGITTVVLSGNGNVFSGADAKGKKTIVESIATATAKAIERNSPDEKLSVLAIDLIEEGEAQIVSVTGICRGPHGERSVSAAKRVSGELADIVVQATIDAFTA